MNVWSRLTPVLAGGIVLAAGCITAPTPERPSEVWTAPARAEAADVVWEGLRNRGPDLRQPLSLAQLTDLALQRNPATRRTWQAARAAAAEVDRAQGLFMPTLTANAGASRTGTTAQPSSFSSQLLNYGPGLEVNYLVINFGGGRAAAVEQALQTVYAADFTFNQSLQDVLLAVANAYYGLISAQAGVESAAASVADASKALEAAKARTTAGVGTELDVLQAQAAFDQARYNEAAARGTLQIARGSLAQAVGVPADQALQTQAPAGDVPAALDEQDVRQLVDAAIAQRPDIAAMRASMKAQESAVKVAHAASWPSLYLNGYLNRDYTHAFSGDLRGADREWGYGIGANVQWTLFNGWQTESQIRGAEAQAAAARAALEQAELAASADVWARFQDYRTAREKYRYSEAALRSAESAQATALSAYQAGLRTILDLLSAESQLAAARSQQVGARQAVFTALANLAHATGRLDGSGSTPAGQAPQAAQKDAKP